MGAYSLELRMLKKIPAKITRLDQPLDSDPAGLDRVYSEPPKRPDDYHIELDVRSRYWTMDDVKKYILETHPEIRSDFNTWSLTGGYHGRPIVASLPEEIHAGTITIPPEIYETLMSEHVNKTLFENVAESWCLDLPRGQEAWLEPLLPCYVSEDMLGKLPILRLAFARKSEPEDLMDRICDAGHTNRQEPDVLGFLSDALAHARKSRCALWACLVK